MNAKKDIKNTVCIIHSEVVHEKITAYKSPKNISEVDLGGS